MAGFERSVAEMAPPWAEVEELEFEDYEEPVMELEKFRAHFTTLQLGKITEVGLGMLERQDQMLGKIDVMLGKQDETLGELRGLRANLRSILDERLRKLEGDVALIKAKLGIERP